MASTSANKRPRTSSSSPEPKQPAPREVNYYPRFTKNELSDIILESSDGVHFATSKLPLQASSGVFRDTLLVGQDASSEMLDGLPVIKLSEDRWTIGQFLPFVQSEPVVPVHPSLFAVSLLDQVLIMCTKYDAPLLGRMVASYAFPHIVDELRVDLFERDNHPEDTLINALAVALIHSRFDVEYWVSCMIAMLGVRGVKDAGVDLLMKTHDVEGGLEEKTQTGWRPYGIGDIEVSLLARIPAEDLSLLSKLQMQILTEKKTSWDDVRERFKVHARS